MKVENTLPSIQYSYGMTFILLLTSLTNKFIPVKLSSTRNSLPWVNQKLKWLARQRDRAFQKHFKRNSAYHENATKATFPNEQLQSVFSRKSSNRLSSLCHMKLQDSTDTDRSMLDITVSSKCIEKLLPNLNPHKAADPDQIKPIILNIFQPHYHRS